MLRVALTGGIATGKSYVRARIEARGVPTIDADAVVHRLLGAGTDVTRAIASRFGAEAIAADGAVNRRALGRVVFGDPAARRDLEAIIHPTVYTEIMAWADAWTNAADPPRWILADIPLLFETGRRGAFDRVLVSACPPGMQRDRLIARDGVSPADAEARLAAQWPIEEKMRLADRVIRTDGSFEETNRQVDEACAWLDGLGETRG